MPPEDEVGIGQGVSGIGWEHSAVSKVPSLFKSACIESVPPPGKLSPVKQSGITSFGHTVIGPKLSSTLRLKFCGQDMTVEGLKGSVLAAV